MPEKPVCPVLTVELPEVISNTELDVEQPPIEDPVGAMDHFHEKLAALLRGKAKDHVRIGVYGDSNMTMDFMTGEMRRVVQKKYGDAGHGFVAAGRPWGWYLHQDVKHDASGPWIAYDVSTDKAPDAIYGFANISMEAKWVGAKSWVQTVDDTHAIGQTFSHFEIYALQRAGGGPIEVKVDDKIIDTLETKGDPPLSGNDKPRAMFKRYDIGDAPHRVELTARGGGVRLFGMVIERDQPGVIIDSLGVGALNSEQVQWVNVPIHQQTLAHRNYDLIIDLTGTNMFSLELHPGWMKKVLENHRGALPDVSLLLLSPPDLGHWADPAHSDPRIAAVAKQKRVIAETNRAAYWDFRGGMGGEASIFKFNRQKFASADLVHLTDKGGAYMGGRILRAIWADFIVHMQKHPTAGCD